MRQKHIVFRLTCLLLGLLLLTGTALAVAEPTPEFYVADYAGVLSQETEAYIVSQNALLLEATGGEIVIVAVDFMDGMSGDEYAMAVAENWGGIGDEERNNGFLLVFATGENKVYAMVGYGLQQALTAAKIEEYLEDTFYDSYDAGEYDTAARDFFDAVCGWYEDYYSVSLSGQTAPGGAQAPPVQQQPQAPVQEPARRSSGLGGVVLVLIVLLILVVVWDSMRCRRYRRRYLMPGMPPPPYVYRPFLFGWGMGRPRRPPPPPRPPRGPRPPMGGGFVGGFGGFGGPPRGSGSRPGGAPRPPRSGGGSFRGGGAGRRGGSSGGMGSFGGGFSGGSRGGFGGGMGGSFRGGGGGFRGGGAGRR